MIELRNPNKEPDFPIPPKTTRLSTKISSPEIPEEIKKELRRKDRELDKIAGLYVEAEGNQTMLTLANDLLLRLFLRSNLNTAATDVFFRDLQTKISAKENTKGRHGENQRERDRAANIRPSIEQLAGFIRSDSARSSEVVFATSPELDDLRGIDLFKCHPVWDESSQKLFLDIELIQAKSGLLDAQGVRDLAKEYQSKFERIQRDFKLSTRWFEEAAREVTPSESELSTDQLFEHFAEQKALVDLLTPTDPTEKYAALKRFHRTVAVYGPMSEIIALLEEQNPYKAPQIEFRSFKFFILVNTARRSEYLDVERAIKYR
jgi:hypothetical protein